MKRFHDIFGHPHEPIVHRGRRHALCHKVAIGLCSVAKTEQEHCQDIPDGVFRRERLPSGKLRHDVGD